MRKLLLASSLVALLAAPLACDLEKTASQLSARKVMVATLLSTPQVDIDPLQLSGLDAGFDGGLPPDAGVSIDGGFLSVPGQTAAFVFLGTRKSESLDVAPEPVPNAAVSLNPIGGTEVALENDGSGNYSKTSVGDSSFRYEQGKSYEFVATLGSDRFVGEVEQVPELERIAKFTTKYHQLPAGQPFTFNRPEPPAGKERNLGFVTVFPISDNGQKGEPTYSNLPSTPLDFLKLVAVPAEWKKTEVVIPGTAFPTVGQTYLVIFQAAKTGGPKSDNLFTGSALLAGTADWAAVRAK